MHNSGIFNRFNHFRFGIEFRRLAVFKKLFICKIKCCSVAVVSEIKNFDFIADSSVDNALIYIRCISAEIINKFNKVFASIVFAPIITLCIDVMYELYNVTTESIISVIPHSTPTASQPLFLYQTQRFEPLRLYLFCYNLNMYQ